MVDNLTMASHDLPMCMLRLLSVHETLLPKCMNWPTNFRDLPFFEHFAID